MRKMELTGGQIKGFKLSDDGLTGYLTVVATVFKNKTKHSIWICGVLKDKVLATYQENPIKAGINMGGSFDVTSFTDPKTNKMHPKIYIIADWFEENEAYGSGLLRVSLSKARLAEDLREGENVAFAKMAYNYTNSDKTMWCDLTFWSDAAKAAKAMKLKKGSTFDLDANFDVDVNTKDDKQYLNILLAVKEIKYSALPVKPKESAKEPDPEPPVTPQTPAAAPPVEENTSSVQETTLDESVAGEPDENDFF